MTDINLLQPATESNASSPDIVWHEHAVNRESREKLHGHQGAVIWFTGLSGSGKSSVAGALEQALHQLGVSTYLLDGDNVRHGLSRDLGFSDDDRIENRHHRRHEPGLYPADGLSGIFAAWVR